jgi:hypothetical protein
MGAVTGMDQIFIGARIARKAFDRSSCNGLVRSIHREDLFRVGIQQPVDLVDAVGLLVGDLAFTGPSIFILTALRCPPFAVAIPSSAPLVSCPLGIKG